MDSARRKTSRVAQSQTQSGGCTSKSRVQVTLCAAGRLSVMEMRRSTDFQIQEVLRLASAAVFWSLCFYEDNHSTGQGPDMVRYLLEMVQKKRKKLEHEAGSYKRSGEGF